jgi:hypothetical protein
MLPAWARLDPLSMSRQVSADFTQTVDHDTLGRGRSPNRVAWRFPDWTAVGFRYRGASPPPYPP